MLCRKDGKCVQFVHYKSHTHGTREKKYRELYMLNLVKQKCVDIKTLLNEKKQSVRDIFYSVKANYPDVEIDFYKIERTLQINRNAALPSNPTTCDDIQKIFERSDIMNLIGMTKQIETFFNGVFESQHHSFCVFSAPKAIKLFQKHEPKGIVVMDATFDIVPLGAFNQILIIYGIFMEKVCYCWL